MTHEIIAPPAAERAAATAPGHMERAVIEARFAALGHQFRHDNTIAPLAPTPDDPVRIWATSGQALPVEHATLFYTTDGSQPDAGSPSVPMSIAGMEWYVSTGFLTRWEVSLPPMADGTIVRYRIGGRLRGSESGDLDLWAHDGQGFWFQFPGERGITTFAYRIETARPIMPRWTDGAVIYHIFLDRFHPGTEDGVFHGKRGQRERHGGTLRGVQRALPYLRNLGVTCLWFSPHCASESYHRYDTMDYFTVDPELGTEEDMRDLVRSAHQEGMRIILDFVPVHCSWHHPAFLAAQQDQNADTYPWFTFEEWPDRYRSFLQVSKHLPSLNTFDPGARAHLIEAAQHWLRDLEVDGFRLDHAIAGGMDFWVAYQSATEQMRPDVLNYGEATDTPDSLLRYRGKLNGVLDFQLATALRSTFGAREWTVGQLDRFITSYDRYMADGPGRLSFLDNHDMERFLYVAGQNVDLLKAAAICQFSLPPVPIVYYGTEVGMTHEQAHSAAGFGGDAQSRQDMLWDPAGWNHDLHSFYTRLIALRREEGALIHGARRTFHLDEDSNTYGYIRSLEAGDGRGNIAAVFNMGEAPATVTLPEGGGTLLLATREEVSIADGSIELPGTSAALVRL